MPCSDSKIFGDGCIECYLILKCPHKVSVAGFEPLEKELVEKGTMQSLSWPDSAQPGAHEFQATAPTGRAVGLFSDSFSCDSNQRNLCNQLRSDKMICTNQLLSDVSKVKIILKNQHFPEMSLFNQDSINPNIALLVDNVIPSIVGVSADQTILSNDNDNNQFSSGASLSIESDCWNPNCIMTSTSIPTKRHLTPPSPRPSRTCTKRKVIYDDSSSIKSSNAPPSRDSKMC